MAANQTPSLQNGIRYNTKNNTISFYDDNFQKEFDLRYGVTGIILARMGPEKKLHVLVNVRNENISDGGLTCLPGGGADKIDRSNRATLARELMEELDIENWRMIEVEESNLDPCVSGSGFLTQSFVLITEEEDLRKAEKGARGVTLNGDEIGDAFFMPLDFIFNPLPGCFKPDAIREPGGEKVGGRRKFQVEQYYYTGPNIEGETKAYVISGPTARVLRQLKEKFHSIEEFEKMLAPYEAKLEKIEDPRPVKRLKSQATEPHSLRK